MRYFEDLRVGETLGIGLAAAALAYLVGFLLRSVV